MRFVVLLLLLQIVWLPTAAADPEVGPGPNSFDAWSDNADQAPVRETGGGAGHATSASSEGRVRFEWRTPCGIGLNGENPHCPQNSCGPGEFLYRLWQVAPPPERPLGLACSSDGPPAVAAAPPQVTEAIILQAFRRIPLPSLISHSQPANKTLINFDTIFFTQAQPLTRQVRLLGQGVRLEITPSRFEWVHGDGTTETTSTPGAPYPAKDVVYRYADAHRTVAHRVVVTWGAEYSLNGGPLRPVNGTVTTTGPATPLRIAEASPALSGSGH
jgi:hypothetical protein